ncbi:hypothetical protein T552_02768 [Pneumocystis carinii B80]|uniref:RNA polymerase II subunit A C-terminal domain phosphatase SSU72 n=1 Tax=Pneumocystis carinii (strain B80) TaxID=1408658 RepID=A0A0W4ZEG3_PNEC8|nr:hypothetical protein T552_02768 [Pneumocystis carinii B80]KTW26767.1 hypothetical protein T552_02768 [Pneumocystis carinii B80]
MAESNTKFAISVICASNQNRSMEAHCILKNAGYNVRSFGTGSAVRLPGPSIDKPNIYPFGTPYDQIYNELKNKDIKLYTANGLLNMLDRNRKIKNSPERWQDNRDIFDIVITCEERCFDTVCEDLINRGQLMNRIVHVINVDIKDNHEEAVIGGQAILKLINAFASSNSLDDNIYDILSTWQKNHPKLSLLHSLHYQ